MAASGLRKKIAFPVSPFEPLGITRIILATFRHKPIMYDEVHSKITGSQFEGERRIMRIMQKCTFFMLYCAASYTSLLLTFAFADEAAAVII